MPIVPQEEEGLSQYKREAMGLELLT